MCDNLLFAQPFLTESYNYVPGATLMSTTNWAQRATGASIVVTANNLSYPSTISYSDGNKVRLSNTGESIYHVFAGTGATTYNSLIVNVVSAQAAGEYFYALGNSTSPLTYGARIYIRSNGAGFSFGVVRGTATTPVPVYETTVRNFNTNYFLVLKYEVVTGATNDAVSLFVNPAPINTEPAVANVIYNGVTGADIGTATTTNLSSVNLYQVAVGTSPVLDLDGIHVGSTWQSVTTAQYDYGDAPASYEQTKDNVFAPALHSPVTGFYIGSMAPDLELQAANVTTGSNNNSPNGDGLDEDGLVTPIDAVSKGIAYSVTVPVNNPTTATKYLYAWIDFNNNGRFELSELTTATLSFTTTGVSNKVLTWTNLQTSVIPDGIDKLYMRLRLSNRALNDFTTAASGGATLDERSIGNGAVSTTNASDYSLVAGGEVEDFQLDVVRLYDFGDLPSGFELDKDNNARPAMHAKSDGLSIGTLVDIESGAHPVAAGQENNQDGDNEHQTADEDGITEFISISRGVAYSIDIPVNSPAGSGTKYLYAWLDLNGDGRFQVGELTTATLSFGGVGATTRTLTWSAAQTTSIPVNTKNIYLRLRLSNSELFDFTTAASGGATIDERSIGNGATGTGNAVNAPTVALGEVEDYQLRVDDYDFGDVPSTYGNGYPARHIAVQTRKIGQLLDNEATPANVAPGADNNGDNGDGADEDGLTGVLPVITKGAPFSFSVPVTVNVATNILAWIDFNNDGRFQLNEAAYTLATGTSQAYQSAAIGTNNITFYFRGSQTHTIPVGVSNVYVRIRLTAATTLQSVDNAATTDIDERSFGDGASTGVYTTPYIGEVEDYRFEVVTPLDYGDVPAGYDINRDGNSRPARNFTTDNLYLGVSYALENGPSSVASGANNNAPNGDGDEEDGLAINQLFVRLGGTNVFNVVVNNTTGAAAILHGWVDFNNNGKFESSEYVSTSVPNLTTGTIPLNFTLAQANTIPADVNKLYMRIRLVQQNAEAAAAIADFTGTGGNTLDERAIADGTTTGDYVSVALGEVEDYQLTVLKDFGDLPVSYENGIPAYQSNTITPELYLGSGIDFELAASSVTAGADNNGTNGDGLDEDAVSVPGTIVVGSPYSLTVPYYSASAGTKYLYAWIDFNGDGQMNGNEVATTVSFTAVVGNNTATLNWTGTQTQAMSATGISSGKVYLRLRLSATSQTNANNANLTSIDTRSFGAVASSGEIEDYQFLVSNLYDYGDAPLSYELNANTTAISVPARQSPSAILRLGLTVDSEAVAHSVTAGNDNNGTNGDGADEDGITNLAPIYNSIAYRTQVSVLNNTGSNKTLHAWIDFNNDGRFQTTEYTSFTVPASASQQTVTLSWAAQTFTVPASNKLYMRLRISEGTLTDRTAGVNPALVDERSLGDGLQTGDYDVLQGGEIEDYQITVISVYDYGDAAPTSYEETRTAGVFAPARQAVSQSLYLGQLYPDAESSKQVSSTTAKGDDINGTSDEDGAVPGPILSGNGYVLNVTYTNISGANRTLYGWIDFNNNGKFESGEVITGTLVNGTYNGSVTLTWTTAQTGSIPNTDSLYMRLRVSELTLADHADATVDERAIGDGANTGTYSALAGNGEIEDYKIAVLTSFDYGDVPLSYEQNTGGTSVPARQAPSALLRLGTLIDIETAAHSVAPGADNNGLNGDGQDEDGITNPDPIYSGIPYHTMVSVLNNTGANKTLHAWIDFDNNGRFTVGEYASVVVPASAIQQSVNLRWATGVAISSAKVYMRLRITDGTVGDGASANVDERSIGDGLSTGINGILNDGEIEDYQLTVISEYDYGDAAPATYDNNTSAVYLPARQAVSKGLYFGNLAADAEPGKQIIANTANGDNSHGTNDEDGAVPGTVTPGGGYSLNVNYTNNSGAARTIHAWIDFNNNGAFELSEYREGTINALTSTTNGVATLTWSTAQSSTIPTGVNSLYMRIRVSEATLADAASANVDERAIGDGLSTGVSAALASNGEIEDYLITVSRTLDYGDVPVSYEQPGGTLAPARQIASPVLLIGGLPDTENVPNSVLAGASNNGLFGDGADEDGIIPESNPVTINSAFTLPVRVTNTSGAARTLFGWLDLNNNGTFELGEVASVSVANATNNATVNLVWTAAQTATIQTEKIYLRLRLADIVTTAGGMFDNTATAYDERAIGDGLSTGAYALAATRGEVEDYQLAVIPVFDYGDAPLSFERNTSDVSVPARHLTVSTLFLGSTFDLEHNASSVATGSDNNGLGGDGVTDDGVSTPLPALNPGGAYSLTVNTFKSIAGTGTIHAWIDRNGDGRFTADEYTSATVTASTGAQIATLTWLAVPYSGTQNYTYIRLRFTTGTVTDNVATTNVDERSIGDGLTTGVYGTPVNGEVEDYYVSVNNGGITTIPSCEGLGSVDPIQAAFHATMVRPASGGYLVFGELAHGNGTSNLAAPAALVSGSNGYNFAGSLLMATLGSTSAFTYHQYLALTTAGLYAWGAQGIILPTAATTGTSMQAVSLPPGVTPAMVKMIDAGASYLTGGTVGDQTSTNGSVVLLTKDGHVWVRSSVNAANETSDFNAVQGDGNLAANNGSTDWHQVQTAAGVPLTGMVDVRTTGAAAIATNGNQFYTWGRNVYIGNATATGSLHYATLMTTPTGFAGPAIKVDMSYGNNLSASYYILDDNGIVHVLGNNNLGQLGIGSVIAQTSWTRITQKNEEPEAAGNQPDVTSAMGRVTAISSNNHDAMYAHLILITADKRAYHAGSNAGGGGMSGTVSPTSFQIPTAMTTGGGTAMLPGNMVYGEAGGHIGVLAKEGSDRYGYVGHTVSGSDGCNGCTNSPSEYNFNLTASTGPLCGITAFDFGDLDERYNLGDMARHQIRYSQSENPLKLGSMAADSEDGPQVTATGSANLANGDDVDEKGDDEDAFSGTLPVKTAGSSYSLTIPFTNRTDANAYIYGFIDWDGNGVFTSNEAVVQTVPSSSTAQTVTLTWADPGLTVGNCLQLGDAIRSFVRLRITSSVLTDLTNTQPDERSFLAAEDGEVEDYYVDWTPSPAPADLGNLPSEGAPVVWRKATASLTSLDLATNRVWLGDNNSYPNLPCESNVERNGGLKITGGDGVIGTGSETSPFILAPSDGTATHFDFNFNITVNGNGTPGTLVYYGMWFDVNGNGSFTDEDDVFVSGSRAHGSPVSFDVPVSYLNGGTNGGATSGAVRLVVTSQNFGFSKSQNGEVNVTNGEVEDYYVAYPVALPVNLLSFGVSRYNQSSALIEWTTQTEENTKHFIVEKFINGEWKNIAVVNASGNSTREINYSVVDGNLLKGNNHYRLKIVDMDGRFKYSQVKSYNYSSDAGITVQPNPAKDKVIISGLAGTGSQIVLLDLKGRIISQEKAQGATHLLNLSGISKGVYFIRIIENGGASTDVKKLIVE
ncbi:GEVED domain-containing protein [Polluticaenibacter yanchengensis]|uniref:T9SS type A sorting domain-containing protein n=1 Tax=Polluticaenibacter yanchengensis TaxID=3014562 RepID=A0ABT4UJT4_9BACT|nr:T9SS type A sorting domain-containing protein [Chitinophagaceae bacterium LY-5]